MWVALHFPRNICTLSTAPLNICCWTVGPEEWRGCRDDSCWIPEIFPHSENRLRQRERREKSDIKGTIRGCCCVIKRLNWEKRKQLKERERERERERGRERGRERPRGYSNNRRLQSLRPKNKQMAWSTLSSLVTGWSTVIKSHGDKRKKRKWKRERERERAGDRERERDRERDKENTQTSEGGRQRAERDI